MNYQLNYYTQMEMEEVNDFKNGHVLYFDKKQIMFLLKKDFELDEILTLDIKNLSKEQKELVSNGLIVKFDKTNEIIYFLTKEMLWV